MLYAVLFIIGLSVGSFLNVVICRLQTKEKILYSRSHCPNCKKVLAWYDLIPLVSFILTLGRCRYCGKNISWQYPLVELSTAVLFTLAFYVGGLTSHIAMWEVKPLIFTLFYCFFVACLIVIFVYDLKHFIIPDKVIYPAIVGGVGFRVFLDLIQWNNGTMEQWNNTIRGLIAAGIAAGFFLAFVLFSQGKWMGWGDVKMACFMGLLLGWPQIFAAIIIAFTAGAIIGIILIIAKKKTLKSQIPFGPFLSAATLISIFWGEKLISWYLEFTLYG